MNRMHQMHRIHPVHIVVQSSQQVRTTGNHHLADSHQTKTQRDVQLVRLSILQVSIYLLLNSVWAISPLYGFITTVRGNRTIEERLWSAFLVGFGFNLIFTYTALTFPIYTLASPRFRQEFVQMIKDIWRWKNPF